MISVPAGSRALLVALALGGCSGAAPAPVLMRGCPAVPTYDAATEKASQAEFDALPPGDPLRRMIIDYGVMRKEARDCAGKR